MTPAELKAWAQEVWQEPGITSTDRASRRNRFIEFGCNDRPFIVPGNTAPLSPTFGLSPSALKRRRKLQTFHPSLKEQVLAEATTITQTGEANVANKRTGQHETKPLFHYVFTSSPTP